jgi:hypothetical protein
VKPTWVNETLSDSDSEMPNGDEHTIKAEPVEERKQKEVSEEDPTGGAETDPLPSADTEAEPALPEDGLVNSEEAAAGSVEENPLGDAAENGEEEEGAAAASAQPEEDLLQAVGDVSAAEESVAKGLEEGFLSVEPAVEGQAAEASFGGEEVSGGELGEDGAAYGKTVLQPATMTEEDLLTGPAHNLDDSQYKSDIVDPNLDDIFK